ncbi:MAG TPA: RdgB/HAM1 family non-canonical purine NTP pyrophosphatase [Blastocatellia bacterium]|nr:RdgB/HAM1 family non-canonical purine NTP pyrophosphatase [Blastocatellia bacterium]
MGNSVPSSLLIATRNRGKLAEIIELLEGVPLTIIGLEAFPPYPEVSESGRTFEENALIKARYYHDRTGLLTVADDSGLMVDALGGEPGIHSARYGPSDAERIARLLDALRDVPPERRTARFVCVVALVGQGIEKTFRGEVVGRIRTVPAGSGGFGYDPVFEYPPLGKTFAELSRAEKSAVSHRGRAFRLLREFLLGFIAETSR